MPNRLAQTTSPYLRQHADNPVQWEPWDEAALARAQREDKPIFLSIGYSTCHWCHVMAHESFEDEEIAAFLNQHFVPIKVDREERPDVDRIYMSYVQAITGHGGWPLSVWLTPDRMAFFGGTYFPPHDRGGHRGFLSLLRAIADGWKRERQTLVNEATRVLATLAHHTRNAAAPQEEGAGASDLIDAGGKAFEGCFQHLVEAFDEESGGFGGAPKFPRASNLHFLFQAAVIQGEETEAGREALRLATTTLQAMARGGLHDHVGGGFHRYTVDAGWQVPHFEKMLYDQAQIAWNFLEAQQATAEERYGGVAASVFDYVERDLTHPEGGFYSAEDADSPTPDGSGHGGRGEGAFYVWTVGEVRAVLGGEAAVVEAHFGMSEGGNVAPEHDPHGEFTGRNILHARNGIVDTAKRLGLEPAELSERLGQALLRLRAARAQRARPGRDEKIIAAWNGLMISALIRGARVLDDERWERLAVRAAEFVQRELYEPGQRRLYRSWCEGSRGEVEAFAEDYALLIQACLDLYEGTAEERWLSWGLALQESLDERFADPAGGYFSTQAGAAHLVLRLKEDYDGAEPAANSVAAMNLFRWRALFPVERGWAERGEALLWSLHNQWGRWPQALPQLLAAIEWALQEPRQLVIAGGTTAPDWLAFRREAFARSGPRQVVLYRTGLESEDFLQRFPTVAAVSVPPTGAEAHVCEGTQCREPVRELAAWRDQLGRR